MPPSPLFTINLDNRKSPFLITHYSPVCVAIDSTKISLSIRIESLKKGDLSIMLKIQKDIILVSKPEMCHITRELKVKWKKTEKSIPKSLTDVESEQ